MENYVKVKSVEEELQENDLPFKNLPSDILWMKVKTGSKISNLLSFALKKVPNDTKSIIWSGSSSAITKCVSCVEMMKNKVSDLHQITKIDYINAKEYWKNKDDISAEETIIERKIPAIFILLTLDPFEEQENGKQNITEPEITKFPKLKSKKNSKERRKSKQK